MEKSETRRHLKKETNLMYFSDVYDVKIKLSDQRL